MASSRPRKCFACPNLLLSFLNVILLLAASASIIILLLLKRSPTQFGWALVAASSVTFLSSLISFCSQLNKPCFLITVSMLVVSIVGDGLGFLMLFSRESESARLLDSNGSREAKFFIRLNALLLLVMFLVQALMLVIVCVVQSCVAAEYRGIEAQRDEAAKRRSKKMAKVHEESAANAKKIEETKAKELDEKMKIKYGQSLRTDDFEA